MPAEAKRARRPRRPKTGSRHALEVRLAFAEWQKAQGVGIRSPEAVAEKYGNGSWDGKIDLWLAQQARRQRLKEHDDHPCALCDSTGWQRLVIKGQPGVVPCPRREALAAGH